MIDRSEFLKFRINNAVKGERTRIVETDTSLGSIAVKSRDIDNTSIGMFSVSKRKLRAGSVLAYFIASDFEGISPRQLWLPADSELSSGRTREVVATTVEADNIFKGWKSIEPVLDDFTDYSPYDVEGEELFNEVKLLLQYAGAVDDSFKAVVSNG